MEEQILPTLRGPQESAGRGGWRSSSLTLEHKVQRGVGWVSCQARWSGRCQIVKGGESTLRGMDYTVLHRKIQNLYWPSMRMDDVGPSASLRASQGVIWTQHPLQTLLAVLVSAGSSEGFNPALAPDTWGPGCWVLGSTSVSCRDAHGNRPGHWDQILAPWQRGLEPAEAPEDDGGLWREVRLCPG